MKFLVNRKLATRIGIITTVITLAGMLLLWRTVSDRVSASSKTGARTGVTTNWAMRSPGRMVCVSLE